MKPKVFITRKIPDQIVEKIAQSCDVRMWEQEDIPVPREILEKEIRDVDGLFCLLTESVDRDLLEKAIQLKVISNMAVGYNNIDIEAAREKVEPYRLSTSLTGGRREEFPNLFENVPRRDSLLKGVSG